MASVLVIEYFLSGGSAHVASSLLLEGYAMLKALCEALSWVGWRVVVPVDERLAPHIDLRASEIVPVRPASLLRLLREGLDSDFALAIAPPMGGVHALLIKALEEGGLKHLGPPSWKVEKYSDKYRQFEELRRRGIPTPRTEVIDDPSPHRVKGLSSIGFPLVLKPRLGAGCEGLFVSEDAEDLERAVSMGAVGEGYIAQEVLKGVHASAPVFSDGLEAWAPCLNAQLIEWGRHPSYEGGLTPLNHPVADRALRVAEETVKVLGLEGYVGVDLVLTDSEAYVIEVNPRPTTSVVSLLEVLGRDLLGNLLASIASGSLGHLIKPEGHWPLACAFIKAKLSTGRLLLSANVRKRLLAIGAYVVTPVAGWVGAGEPISIVKATAPDANAALSKVRRLKAEVETLISMHLAKPPISSGHHFAFRQNA